MCKDEYAEIPKGLTRRQEILKRLFDLSVAVPGLILTSPIVLIAVLLATLDTKEWGIFSQVRIGRGGEPFNVYKIRSMRSSTELTTTVTSKSDPRITKLGSLLRRSKIDELVQLWNVIVGDMSLVGPRPDVPGWADRLEGCDRIVLSLRPGITGPASIYFRAEEEILSKSDDPEALNKKTIWPKKVELNRQYIAEWSLRKDIVFLKETLIDKRVDEFDAP